ncbi:Uncharacterised protein [uncultured archaeon]|nr:Uncharacterised protein [uncultured archaeon]
MRIDEIETLYSVDLDYTTKDWNQITQDFQHEIDNKTAKIFKLGEFFVVETNLTVKESLDVGLFKGSTCACYLSLRKMLSNQKPVKNNVYWIEIVRTRKEFRGQGLALKLYEFLLKKHGFTLVSGGQQTAQGKHLWERLRKIPGIFIYGWNRKKKELFQLSDPFDFSEDYIHDSDFDEEIKYLKDELEEKHTHEEKLKLELQLDKLLMQQKESQHEIFLVATTKIA